MTSNPEPNFQVFFDLIEEWKLKKEKVSAPDCSRKELDEYYEYCREHFVYFSEQYLQRKKETTRALCEGFLKKAQREMLETQKRLASLHKK